MISFVPLGYVLRWRKRSAYTAPRPEDLVTPIRSHLGT